MSTELLERDFNTAQRKAAAKTGAAMPDGSYPIKNKSDLKNAIQAIGRTKNPAAVKAHIRTRAKALGASELLPDNWKESLQLVAFGESLLYEADGVTPRSGSFDAIRQKVQDSIQANIRAGNDMDCDDDGPQDAVEGKYAWVMDIFPETVVYSMDGCLFQCAYAIDGEGEVKLGMPQEVETSYTPVGESGNEAGAKAGENESNNAKQEPQQFLGRESISLSESAYDASKGELTVSIIKPGFSKNLIAAGALKGRRRYYPAESLKRDHKIFDGAKMFADHATDKESKERPEGSVHNWVANIGKTWSESDGTVKGTATVIDPPFKAKLDRLNDAGLLKEMNVSVRIAAEVSPAEIEGQEAARIDQIAGVRSVDFVTFGAAGGQIEAMESEREEKEQENDFGIAAVTEAQLRKQRPDLVELIESKFETTKDTDMKSMEQQLEEAQRQIKLLEQEKKTLETQNAESAKLAGKAAVQVELAKQLTESKLPDISKQRVRQQFAEVAEAKEVAQKITEAITQEVEYVKALGGDKQPAGKKNMGTADNGTQESDSNRATKDKNKADLEEAFALLPGMSEKDAKLAAQIQ